MTTSPLDGRTSADVQATFCATLVDEWVRCGVAHAVVAPGSRSTPMALALAEDERVTVHIHHDERAAAFTAHGIGLASGHPAIVLTTSGTAAVELHPAIVEADLAGVPLLAITADRPPELHHVGAPQTVDQQHLFGRSARWFVDPGVADAEAGWSWRSLAARAVAEATTGPAGPGPVHLNLPFREPLLGSAASLPPGRDDGARWHTTVGRRSALTRLGTERLGALLDVDRGVIVAGAGAGNPDLILELATSTGWPVLADPRSGCRRGHRLAVTAFDAIVRHEPAASRLAPEVVLVLGAPPASKELARWIRSSRATVVAVDEHGRWFDADRQAAHVLHASPDAAVAALGHLVGRREGPVGGADGAWAGGWLAAEAAAQQAIDEVLDAQEAPTEPGVARAVVGALCDVAEGVRSTLVVSSSMPVRDLEWFGGSQQELRVLANRGANGIDGVVSTAVGVAIASKSVGASTVVVVGDVAMQHDANALLGIAARELDLTVIVVDNDGGGIFSFLPQAEALDGARFELLFGTPHGVDLATQAAAHGLVTIEPAGAADVATAVAASVAAGGTRVVRVATDRTANVAIHDELHRAVARALDGLGGGGSPAR